MGQYYHPISIDKKQNLYSHDFSSGMKLMEHSYLRNDFVQGVEVLLTPFGAWHKTSLVWAGDYADEEEGTKGQGYEGGGVNLYSMMGGEENKIARYDIDCLVKEHDIKLKDYKYICNHTLKVYIDKTKVEEFEKGWTIHPLPLLTCEGNGRGGGDFHGEDEAIGSWARNIISIEKDIPEGFTETTANFKEE